MSDADKMQYANEFERSVKNCRNVICPLPDKFTLQYIGFLINLIHFLGWLGIFLLSYSLLFYKALKTFFCITFAFIEITHAAFYQYIENNTFV